MCGICGVWSPSNGMPIEVTKSLMLDIQNRGPDASGFVEFANNQLSLGHRRLSIIDINGSHQPMTSFNQRFTITFNGEIYNYRELRIDLDYPFQTEGDTETILALWEKMGADCISKLRGQFAFAIWDSQNETISFVTDAFGILPLYIYDDGVTLSFSSSAKSLASQFPTSIKDPSQLHSLLTRRAVVAPETVFKGIRRLPPGSLWVYSKNTKKESLWNPSWGEIQEKNKDKRSVKTDTLVRLLNQAADRAITSDVEVGVFLSGGVDSAVVAKLAQERLPYKMHAYTAYWPGDDKSSEINQARKMARELKLNHHLVSIDADSWWSGFIQSSLQRESPIAEPADVVLYLLSERAKQDVKVVLTGEGSDEFFGGYPKNQIEQFASQPGVSSLANFYRSTGLQNSNDKIDRVLSSISEKDSITRWSKYFSTIWPESFGIKYDSVPQWQKYENSLRGMRVFDFTEWLAPILLDRADQMAMTHGLEVRPILLDVDIAEFAFSLPAKDLYRLGQTKPLFRDAANLILGRSTTHIPKRGFPIPISEWFAGPLQGKLIEILAQPNTLLDPMISQDSRLKYLYEQQKDKKKHVKRIFTLISLITWFNSNLEITN